MPGEVVSVKLTIQNRSGPTITAFKVGVRRVVVYQGFKSPVALKRWADKAQVMIADRIACRRLENCKVGYNIILTFLRLRNFRFQLVINRLF